MYVPTFSRCTPTCYYFLMKKIEPPLIAPCGMNCSLCLGYQREKNHCKGCRNEKAIEYKTKGSAKCVIKKCEQLKNTNSGFCYDCIKFPCTRLKQLDKRYRTKYNMSMIENLQSIKEKGVKDFIKQENTKWECSKCKGLICIHRGYCLNCKEKNS